ncbi:MAG: 6-bladed beta-propeller [Cecembia sp.]
MKHIFKALALIVLAACSEKSNDPYENMRPTFEVSVESETPIHDILNVTEIIPLRQLEGNFLSQINRLVVTEDFIFVLDEQFTNLIRYNSKGIPLNRISKFGNGPEEMPVITDFTVDQNSKTIILLNQEEKSLHTFDFDNRFIGKKKLDHQADMIGLNKDNEIGLSITYFNEAYHNFQLINSEIKNLGYFFPFPQDVFAIGLKNISGHLTKGFDGKLLYNEPASSIIWEISKEKLQAKYAFSSKNPMWPETEKHKLNSFFMELSKGELDFLGRFFEETGSHLVFQWNRKKSPSSNRIVDFRIGVFDKRNKQSKISLPDNFTRKLVGPLAAFGNDVYFYILLKDLIQLADADILSKFRAYIQEDLSSIGDLDLPVLLKMELAK